MASESVLQELEDTRLAVELISLGARMQLLEHAVRLSRGKMTRLYRELRGTHRLKVCFPFQPTGLWSGSTMFTHPCSVIYLTA